MPNSRSGNNVKMEERHFGPFFSTPMNADDPDLTNFFSNTICEDGYWSVFGNNMITNDTGNSQEMSVPLKQASSKIPTRTFEIVPNRKCNSKGRVEMRNGEPFSVRAVPHRISVQDRLATLKASFRKEENEMSWITRKFNKEVTNSNLAGSKIDESNRFAAAFSNKPYNLMIVPELPAHPNLILNNEGDVYVDNEPLEGSCDLSQENAKTPPSRHSVEHCDVKQYFQNESPIKQRNFEEDEPKTADERCSQVNEKFNSDESDISNYSSCDQEEVEMKQNCLSSIFELMNEMTIEKIKIDKKWKMLRQEQKSWNEKWIQLSRSLQEYKSTILTVNNERNKRDRKAARATDI